MTYQTTWINRLAQFNTVQYDVIYRDDAGILPDVRLSKNIDLDDDTPQGLALIAQSDIANITSPIVEGGQ